MDREEVIASIRRALDAAGMAGRYDTEAKLERLLDLTADPTKSALWLYNRLESLLWG